VPGQKEEELLLFRVTLSRSDNEDTLHTMMMGFFTSPDIKGGGKLSGSRDWL
jgi:hypothetical protein